jgi:predicted nucleic acid-binding protein
LIVYPDSSFLAAHYLTDGHSVEAGRRLTLNPRFLITPFHRAEIANAIFQWVFRGRISTSDAELAYADFKRDCEAGIWVLVSPPESSLTTCADLAHRHTGIIGCRTLDTLHVAAALELGVDAFWTFDQRQARLAEAAGLSVS